MMSNECLFGAGLPSTTVLPLLITVSSSQGGLNLPCCHVPWTKCSFRCCSFNFALRISAGDAAETALLRPAGLTASPSGVVNTILGDVGEIGNSGIGVSSMIPSRGPGELVVRIGDVCLGETEDRGGDWGAEVGILRYSNSSGFV